MGIVSKCVSVCSREAVTLSSPITAVPRCRRNHISHSGESPRRQKSPLRLTHYIIHAPGSLVTTQVVAWRMITGFAWVRGPTLPVALGLHESPTKDDDCDLSYVISRRKSGQRFGLQMWSHVVPSQDHRASPISNRIALPRTPKRSVIRRLPPVLPRSL